MPRYTKAEAGPNDSVIYFSDDGKRFQFSGGSRAWRNQNPGNLVSGLVSKRNGSIGKAGRFAVRLTKKGKIDAVVATSRSGKLFLRAKPDKTTANNLDNMG